MNQNLVSPFSQVSVMAGLQGHSAAATGGACHNFTIDWLSQMMTGEGAYKDAGTQRANASKRMDKMSKGNGGGSPVLQKVFSQYWAEGGDSYQKADQMMIGIRGLQETGVIPIRPYSSLEVSQAIKKLGETGIVYSFWFDGSVVGAAGGAHTIGFFKPRQASKGQMKAVDRGIRIFDPNFGEYLVTDGSFRTWFRQYRASYGPFTQHMFKFVK